jgi:hypothetical protein
MFTQALQLQLYVTNHLGIAVTTFIVSVVVLTANFTCSKVRGSTPRGYHFSILYLYSNRGTMPHHRANPLVPHLLTVRVTFREMEIL